MVSLARIAEPGTGSVSRRIALLQETERQLPWFTYIAYQQGRPGKFIVSCGNSGPIELVLSQVEVFVAGARAAHAALTGLAVPAEQLANHTFSASHTERSSTDG